MQRIIPKSLMFLCALGTLVCASIAQEPRASAKVDSVPDALGLDVASEGILAREDVRNTEAELTAASLDGLKLIIGKSDGGLVPGLDFGLDNGLAAKTFVDSGWVAARRLVNETGKLGSRQDKRTADNARGDSPPRDLLSLAKESASIDELILSVDRMLQRRWTARAREMLYAIEPTLCASVEEDTTSGYAAISWMEAYERICLLEKQNDQQMKLLVGLVRKRAVPPQANQRRDWLAQLWMRLLYCSMLDQDQNRFDVEREIVSSLFGDVAFAPKASSSSEMPNEKKGENIAKTIENWQRAFKGRIDSLRVENQKQASVPLSAYSNKAYEYQFEDQRYAPPKILFPGYPPTPWVMNLKPSGDMVLGRASNMVFGWQAGQAWHWPDVKQVEQLNLNPNWSGPDLNLADEASLGGFARYKDVVFALVDSRERSSASSDILRDALLVGLKMPEGTRSIDNTPMSAQHALANALTLQSKSKLTFSGTPLVAGERLFVMVVDNARGRSYRIACFTLPSLDLAWLSGSVGIEGSEAGGLSNACMLYREGRLMVANGRGSIAAFQANDGKTVFQVNYSPKIESPYDGGMRFHVRSAMVAYGEMIVCGPSDCDTIFAIDYSDGHVHWAMERDQAKRAMQIVGVLGGHLICLGDRIQRINLCTGAPNRVVELSRNAIPLGGQAELIDESIVWTNGMSIYRYPLQALDQKPTYAKVDSDDLEKWPYASRELLAFGISKSHLSVMSASSWIIFEAK